MPPQIPQKKITWVISLGRWKWVEILISDIDPRILLVSATVAVGDIDLKVMLVAGVGLREHHPQYNIGVAHLIKRHCCGNDFLPSGLPASSFVHASFFVSLKSALLVLPSL